MKLMNEEKLKEKLEILLAKEEAYDLVLDRLIKWSKDEKLTPLQRDTFYSVWRMAQNCKQMVRMARYIKEDALKEL